MQSHVTNMPKEHKLVQRASLFSLLAVVLLLIAGCGGSSTSPKTSASATTVPNIQPSNPVFPTAPPAQGTPTKVPSTSGTPVVGSNVGTFVSAFGQPNSGSDAGQGDYLFSLNGKGTNDLTVTTDTTTQLVSSVSTGVPANRAWSQDQAIAACQRYLPTDSTYQRQMTFSDAQGNPTQVQRVYLSPSLASKFPASQFHDENAKPTQPGTVGMILDYIVTGGTTFTTCTVQVGLRSK